MHRNIVISHTHVRNHLQHAQRHSHITYTRQEPSAACTETQSYHIHTSGTICSMHRNIVISHTHVTICSMHRNIVISHTHVTICSMHRNIVISHTHVRNHLQHAQKHCHITYTRQEPSAACTETLSYHIHTSGTICSMHRNIVISHTHVRNHLQHAQKHSHITYTRQEPSAACTETLSYHIHTSGTICSMHRNIVISHTHVRNHLQHAQKHSHITYTRQEPSAACTET